jgi:hypothetical protein
MLRSGIGRKISRLRGGKLNGSRQALSRADAAAMKQSSAIPQFRAGLISAARQP